MKLGIIIATYQRSVGNTPYLLSRALESIKNQTHQDYKVFLIGDKYEDHDEFLQLATSIIPLEKIYFENLSIAIERDRYTYMPDKLWYSGGVNAMNYGIKLAIKDGCDYICHLDHDDYWHPQHLEIINHTIEITQDSAFIYTCGTYYNSYLPKVILNNEIIEKLPIPCQTIHSSVCINHSKIPLLYRDVYEETGQIAPSDADMWVRISEYIKINNLKSYLIPTLTCYHPTEKQ
jgi:glycosyltransferase involved in cell wall biosynthesis